MYELLARQVPMYVMDLPQKPDSSAALAHWMAEVKHAKAFLEHQLGVTIGDDDLRRAVELGNRQRQLITQIYYCRKQHPAPIMGLDFINIMTKLRYAVDFEAYLQTLEAFLSELRQRAAAGQLAHAPDRPRILWTGLGNSLGCSKVLELVETCGGVVVCEEGCGGVTRTEDLIRIREDQDPIEAIAGRYLQVTCACMTPNAQRLADLERLIDEFRIDGVIDLAWQFCQPFEIESYRVKELVRDQLGLPFLHVVTDYSQSDTEQLRVRIEGFMEQIAVRKTNGLYRRA
jgi:benzoyl-CoA reductase/2-hydroxyglutaryl-CoA dehydratase subunit BcrC/BadD/HgdB